MITIKVRIGETLEKALRALKKKLDKEGVMKFRFSLSTAETDSGHYSDHFQMIEY